MMWLTAMAGVVIAWDEKVRDTCSSAHVTQKRQQQKQLASKERRRVYLSAGYLFIKIQCSFKVFEARVDHTTVVVVT